MRTAETKAERGHLLPPRSSSKIRESHLQKLAIVYVRQSSPQQVLENRESTARQYALVDFAQALGWPAERVQVIDEDQGQSGTRADNRAGYQRLLTEVTLDHVGLVLGLEMSRLARSSKDWHHLLEVCGLFGSLLADQDGVYEPSDPNDRLLLGLKGTMSEVELHTMRNRLQRGRLNKAQRGEWFCRVPRGYVILPGGGVALDPDAQVRAVIHLLFEKFVEIGSVYGLLHYLVRHEVQLPVRPWKGPNKGQLEWQRPKLTSLAAVFRNPIYAGAYVYGRHQADAKSKYSGSKVGQRSRKPMAEWQVLIKDRLPAYITWERYGKNQEKLRHNLSRWTTLGTPRQGLALLGGLVVCGNCGRRMSVNYTKQSAPSYGCNKHSLQARERSCYGLRANEPDDLVTQQVLRALEPAALELSVRAWEDIAKDRARLDQQWQQRLQRVRCDIDLAERRYQAVDPANRLVAASLEARWEEALQQERQLREDYDRFLAQSPPRLSDRERSIIQALAKDIPPLWRAPATTNADRKQIVRLLVERVVVHVHGNSEYVSATMHWKGGYQSEHEFTRAVANYGQLRDFDHLLERLQALRAEGRSAPQIAQALSAEGFHPPRGRGPFTTAVINRLLQHRGFGGNERQRRDLLRDNEWWLIDLARELQMSALKLRDWAARGWLHSRRTTIQRYWVLWADADELERLRTLLAQSRRGINAYATDLTTPKQRATTEVPDQSSERPAKTQGK
jgi:DNA invertase Pin-like site-specific DNA recombinase